MRQGIVAAQALHKGVRVRRLDPTAPVASILKVGDILLTFDGTAIANDGACPAPCLATGLLIGASWVAGRRSFTPIVLHTDLVDALVRAVRVTLVHNILMCQSDGITG